MSLAVGAVSYRSSNQIVACVRLSRAVFKTGKSHAVWPAVITALICERNTSRELAGQG